MNSSLSLSRLRRCGRRFAVAVVALTAAATVLPAAASAVGPANVLVIGDSISQGTAGDFTWRYRLAKSWAAESPVPAQFVGARTALFNVATNLQDGNAHYLDPDFNQQHDAVWGRSLTGQAPLVGASIAALPVKPQAVVVELGTNDHKLGAAAALGSMRTLIAGVREAAPTAALVLAKPYAPYSFKDKAYEHTVYTAQFGAGLDGLAAELTLPTSPIVTADLATGFEAAKHTWDGSHPTPAGEIKIAKAVGAGLSTLGIGSGYQGPDSANWAATAPAATTNPNTGRVTVAWPDSTPGVLSYALEQRRRTAADPVGSWVRVGIFARTVRSWASPQFATADSFDYRLIPVRGVMEGVPGPTVTAAATTAAPPVKEEPTGTTPVKQDPTPVTPVKQEPVVGLPTPQELLPPTPATKATPKPTTPVSSPNPAAKIELRAATARRVGTGMRVNVTFTSTAACPAAIVIAVRTSARVTLQRTRVPVKTVDGTCMVAASVKLPRKIRARTGLKVLISTAGVSRSVALAKLARR